VLTDTYIRKLKPPAKDAKHWDERGLFLLATASGGKRWRFKYRFAGKEKLLAIGTYPDVSLVAAREARDDARRLLARDIDPSQHKKQTKRAQRVAAANSFELVAREWFENVKDKWAAVTYSDAVKRFEVYVFPDLGHRPIAEVAAPELLDVLRKVEGLGNIVTAHKIANHCGQIFAYGIGTGRCERNPARDLKGVLKARPKAKPMAAVKLEDLPDLLRKIDKYDTEEHEGEEQTKLALQLLSLTLVRTTELRGAQWPEFDFDNAGWEIPAERMKAGLPHFVPLSHQAMGVLRRLKEMNGNRAYVFPGRSPMKPISKNTMLFAVYRMGYHSRMTVHGFRAIGSTYLNGTHRFHPDVIERQLAHGDKDAVRAAYNRAEHLEARRQMMQHWADYLDAQAGRIETVVPLKAKIANR
jgi:integrase